MTAPNATQAPSNPDTRTRRAPARRDDRDTSRPRSSSAQRALDRRQKRLEQQRAVLASGGTLRETPAERALRRHRDGAESAGLMARLPRPRAVVRRVPFVLTLIALVCAGLGMTLWLSTGSAENSYELTRREAANTALAEKKAALERDVKSGESAPGLAERATALGMIPAGTVPVLVGKEGGKVVVVGKPEPATGAAKPALNPPAPRTGDPSGATSNGSGTPVAGNSGPAPAGGEQLVTMNPGSPTVVNAPTTAPSPAAQSPAPSPAPQTPAQGTPR
ncbi:hypothetical protein TPB0596_18670 [Tsukamurella pulmonis]|uniref:Cell division protein FtsL n=1 Tax=Tsukamurella pulmonis TaxID=47312 RepID=A0A1H1FXK6_9ACTN|nr:hypothetical protein [Tsukamurella pulmonis]KXO87733.1 hypothetical protein AXK56_15110 [Tsukamurella pulmonis]KXP10662.1 hypothetical protein AXK57_10090 [Tsukamurella pulmonis]SDR05651.1 hypothetical protein SAMN04489765_2976 [Tsukamurella pulmonis]SUP18253.1 Uncharacterised protein [Tsukamurella pulmonis]BDD82104.1 hypothetical protein TPB0596_18670 [Tsukamurella pulmonis]